MPHQPPQPPTPEPHQPRPPVPPDPASLAAALDWPLGVVAEGAVDCPTSALNRTLARLETTRGAYHLVVTRNPYTRGRSLWVAWLPRETGLLTLIDEQPEGQIDQALLAIARHLVAGQPT